MSNRKWVYEVQMLRGDEWFPMPGMITKNYRSAQNLVKIWKERSPDRDYRIQCLRYETGEPY